VRIQSEPEKRDLIKQAIQDRKQIIALHKGLRLEMCPHALGWKGGSACALFYQFGGQGSIKPVGPDGDPVNWRCLPVDQLSVVVLRDGSWFTAPTHSRPNDCVDELEIEIQ
jgi:hypothetical protein